MFAAWGAGLGGSAAGAASLASPDEGLGDPLSAEPGGVAEFPWSGPVCAVDGFVCAELLCPESAGGLVGCAGGDAGAAGETLGAGALPGGGVAGLVALAEGVAVPGGAPVSFGGGVPLGGESELGPADAAPPAAGAAPLAAPLPFSAEAFRGLF